MKAFLPFIFSPLKLPHSFQIQFEWQRLSFQTKHNSANVAALEPLLIFPKPLKSKLLSYSNTDKNNYQPTDIMWRLKHLSARHASQQDIPCIYIPTAMPFPVAPLWQLPSIFSIINATSCKDQLGFFYFMDLSHSHLFALWDVTTQSIPPTSQL